MAGWQMFYVDNTDGEHRLCHMDQLLPLSTPHPTTTNLQNKRVDT